MFRRAVISKAMSLGPTPSYSKASRPPNAFSYACLKKRLYPQPAPFSARWRTALSGGIPCPSQAGSAALWEIAGECVLVCLPEEAALSAAGPILGAMADGALWVDTLSVKSGICRLLGDCRRSIEMVSINPMFAPALGWQGHPVAVIALSSGPKSQTLINLLRSWGAAVEVLTAEAHDSLTAIIQVATHAAILSFGALLLDLEYSVERGLAIATPPHRL